MPLDASGLVVVELLVRVISIVVQLRALPFLSVFCLLLSKTACDQIRGKGAFFNQWGRRLLLLEALVAGVCY